MSADALIVRAWDGNSLTLFGVLYGIVVTVAGVLIATASPGWLIIYAIASLALLAVLLLFFGQPVIGWMRCSSKGASASLHVRLDAGFGKG